MPDLDTSLHLDMLKKFKSVSGQGIYGMAWGDPETMAPLNFVKFRFINPYLSPAHTALEIGPGGGRWTRYLLGFKQLYVVDFHSEILDELRQNFNLPNMEFIKNNGTDFPGVPDRSIDYLFSFGTFVHLDLHLIEGYLENISRIMKPEGNVVVQYADKTKDMAKINATFSDNTPDKMRDMVEKAGYRVLEEDLTTLWHSSMIRFRP